MPAQLGDGITIRAKKSSGSRAISSPVPLPMEPRRPAYASIPAPSPTRRRSWLTGGRSRYRASRSSPSRSSGGTVTEVWAEKPECCPDGSRPEPAGRVFGVAQVKLL